MYTKCAECHKKLHKNEVVEWSRTGYIFLDYCEPCSVKLVNSINQNITYIFSAGIIAILLYYIYSSIY